MKLLEEFFSDVDDRYSHFASLRNKDPKYHAKLGWIKAFIQRNKFNMLESLKAMSVMCILGYESPLIEFFTALMITKSGQGKPL